MDELKCRQAIQAYLACTTFVDAQVGRLLDEIDATGQSERTIVVLWSDHGYHLSEHLGVWQKRTLFEESARSPLVIRVPGVTRQGSSDCDRVVEFVDVYPTLVELCGLPQPPSLQGRSLRPLLADPSTKWDSAAVTQVLRPADGRLSEPVMGRSVRTERWRYTQWNRGAAGEEIYDHWHDPDEFTNLAELPRHEALKRELAEHFRDRAQPLPPSTETYNPARL